MSRDKDSKIIRFPGRRQLVIDPVRGVISADGPTDPQFDDRLERIRSGLDRINKLMAQLRELDSDTTINETKRRWDD